MAIRRYETIVGIFVVLSLGALLIMILIIAQQEHLWQEHVEYQAVFRNVAGLKVNAEVRLAGVTVGSVRKITVNPNGTILVAFDVLKKNADHIRWDSRAHIATVGLLGDKSLDISAGSATEPPVPPGGLVASVEPMDFSDLMAKATPSLEELQKVLKTLSSITAKVDEGQGTLGKLVNDAKLYNELAGAATSIHKVTGNLEQGKGLLGMLTSDQKLAAQTKKTIQGIEGTVGNLQQFSGQLPGMAKQGGGFLENLREAGKGLPGLVTSGEALFSDADTVAKAAQKSWLLRSHVPKPQEHTIRLERDAGRD